MVKQAAGQPRILKISDKITLLAESAPHCVSSAIYWWVGCGSRHESPALNGATHLAEHMFFKGTSQHSAEELSFLFERFGGDVNAFTERELTCFHAWVPAEKTELALNLLAEMLFDSLFTKEDFTKERAVVVEELKGYEDSPDEVFQDGLLDTPWSEGRSLGRRIGGFARDVKRLSGEDLLRHVEDRFLRSPMAIGIVTPLEPGEVARLLRAALARVAKMRFGRLAFERARRPSFEKARFTARPRAVSRVTSFDTDQVHVGVLFSAPSIRHRDEPSMTALSNLLGGGSSSALFRTLREDKGLTYSAHTTYQTFVDTGLLSIQFATNPRKWEEALEAASEVCHRFARGIGESELEMARGQLLGSTQLGFESIHGRAEMYGRQWLLMGRIYSLKESLKEIRELTVKGISRFAHGLAATPCLYLLGPLRARDMNKAWKAWEAGASAHR